MRAASDRSCWSIECLRVVVTSPTRQGSRNACHLPDLWKTCGRPVDRLWTFRQRTFFSSRFRHNPQACPLWVRLRQSFRLNGTAHALECSLTHWTGEVTSLTSGLGWQATCRLRAGSRGEDRDNRRRFRRSRSGHNRRRSNVNVHRFEETINGRSYRIEVSSVGAGQWRAQIARPPGGSAALMPFYGKTPDEAAKQLSRWLGIVHGQNRGPARPGTPPLPGPQGSS